MVLAYKVYVFPQPTKTPPAAVNLRYTISDEHPVAVKTAKATCCRNESDIENWSSDSSIAYPRLCRWGCSTILPTRLRAYLVSPSVLSWVTGTCGRLAWQSLFLDNVYHISVCALRFPNIFTLKLGIAATKVLAYLARRTEYGLFSTEEYFPCK